MALSSFWLVTRMRTSCESDRLGDPSSATLTPDFIPIVAITICRVFEVREDVLKLSTPLSDTLKALLSRPSTCHDKSSSLGSLPSENCGDRPRSVLLIPKTIVVNV